MSNRLRHSEILFTAGGSAVGSLFKNPALAFLVGAAGSAIAQYAHYYTAVRRPHPPSLCMVDGALRWLDFYDQLLLDKVIYDFKLSPLGNRDLIGMACVDIASRCRHFGIADNFLEQVTRVITEHPRTAAGASAEYEAHIGRLSRRERPLRIHSLAMHPALAAAFMDMRDRLGIPIELDTCAANGVVALDRAAKRLSGEAPYDFLVLPNSVFFMARHNASTAEVANAYSLILPVYRQQQHVIGSSRDGGRSYSADRYIYLESSSAVEMIEGFKQNGHSCFKESPYELGTRFDPLALQPNERLVAWAPLDQIVLAFRRLQSLHDYRYWISLYMSLDVSADAQLRTDFLMSFLASWTYCKANPYYAAGLIYDDLAVHSDFRQAAQCQIGGY